MTGMPLELSVFISFLGKGSGRVTGMPPPDGPILVPPGRTVETAPGGMSLPTPPGRPGRPAEALTATT